MQFSKTWESTPDGREGFQNIFLRRGFATYLVDQPRRGNAGRSTVPTTITPVADEQNWFNIFRIGVFPDYFDGVQFARDEETLNQYFRQITPNTGDFDLNVISDATAALFDKIGGGVFVTHSQGGGIGWATAIKSRNVRGIVSYELGSGFVFPEGEAPAPLPSSAGALEAVGIPLEDFMQLTKIPIVIYYGDNIPAQPSDNSGADGWRVRLAMARLWADAVNKRGGDVTVVHLPESGIYGNTHFPFSDLNNVQIADLLSEWLKEKGLDEYSSNKTKDMKTSNTIFPKGEKIANNNFKGTAYLQMLMTNAATFDCTIGNVVFEAGCRNSWHSHPGGQILLVTSGEGYYQEKGKLIQVIKTGDVIEILPDVVHWHGATPYSGMEHIAIGTKASAGAAVWLEPVTDEEYNSTKK
jgi:quercetin dioxygenase-like cupin family protein